MGWSLGWDRSLKRDVGYAVPAFCDYPGCNEVIDRGMSFVCGGDIYGGDHGCGMHFCEEHLGYTFSEDEKTMSPQLCERCQEGLEPFPVKPDHPKWLRWKATHESWEEWRCEKLADKAREHRDLDWYSRPRNRKRFWELYARGKARVAE